MALIIFWQNKLTAKGLFRISRKGGVGPFAGVGLPVSNKVSGGYQNFMETPMGVSIFYTHKKRTRTWQNAPFARFAPAALKRFRHPGVWGYGLWLGFREKWHLD